MIGDGLGPQSLRALSHHGESLVELKLPWLPPQAVLQVSLLKTCTNLVSLSLSEHIPPNLVGLKQKNKIASVETVAWLKACKKLRNLTFAEFSGASTLLAPILLENSIRLTSLAYKSHRFSDIEKLLPALASQTSLQFLCLKEIDFMGDTEKRANTLVKCLSNLVNLTELHTSKMYGDFTNWHIFQLASSLPKLEVWSTSGYELTDRIWGGVASLRSLRTLIFDAQTIFTFGGILNCFVEQLGPGNRGLFLNVRNSGRNFSRKEQNLIQERINQKVGGEFDFCYERGI